MLLLFMASVQLYGFIVLAVGAAIRYWIGRRRFYRRGVGGLQQFSTYNKALANTFFERVMGLMALLLIVFGMFLFVVGWYNNHATKKAQESKQTSYKS